jgi:glycogen debranching enzyme
MAAYNPISYHNGSVWPHDNAICAAGLARYGFVDEAHRVIGAQLDVAGTNQGRLPELFAGFDRGRPASPAAYPTSCVPQAWAAAAPLLWLRILLGIDPVAGGAVHVDPRLPPWMHRLRVEGIAVAGHELTVEVDATGGARTTVSGAGPLRLIDGPVPP